MKEEVKEAAGPLQVCAGHSAGSEAAIHAISQVFVEEGTDGILLIEASNVFNQMNKSVVLHNIQITCEEMSLYIINTYRSSSRLFICGGGEILGNRRLSHDAAAGSRRSSPLPSCRNLNLRFVVKKTTLVRAAGTFSRRF